MPAYLLEELRQAQRPYTFCTTLSGYRHSVISTARASTLADHARNSICACCCGLRFRSRIGARLRAAMQQQDTDRYVVCNLGVHTAQLRCGSTYDSRSCSARVREGEREREMLPGLPRCCARWPASLQTRCRGSPSGCWAACAAPPRNGAEPMKIRPRTCHFTPSLPSSPLNRY